MGSFGHQPKGEGLCKYFKAEELLVPNNEKSPIFVTRVRQEVLDLINVFLGCRGQSGAKGYLMSRQCQITGTSCTELTLPKNHKR